MLRVLSQSHRISKNFDVSFATLRAVFCLHSGLSLIFQVDGELQFSVSLTGIVKSPLFKR